MTCIHGKKLWQSQIVLSVSIVAGYCTAALAQSTITGVAHNRSQSRLAAADEVILLRLGRGLQEEAHAKTNAEGAFTFAVQSPNQPYLVRVVHQGVNYDLQALANHAVSIDVFDTAAKLQDIAGTIEIIRIGTNGSLLHVSDMLEVRNNSSPPLTQAGERTLEVYLPAQAKIDSVLAAGSDNIGVMISAAHVLAHPELYTVNFPLRPGVTKFAFNYDLPYDGHATFHPKHTYSLQQLAVMFPPTMKFASPSAAFQVLAAGNKNYQVEAANLVKPGVGPEFEMSGVGAPPAMPASQAPAKTPIPALSPSAAPLFTSGGSPARQPALNALSPLPMRGLSDPSSRWQSWMLSASTIFLLGACGFLLWDRHRLSTNAAPVKIKPSKQTPAPLLDALKVELFQLEIDRSQGALSPEKYASAKQVLDATIKWALERSEPGTTTGL